MDTRSEERNRIRELILQDLAPQYPKSIDSVYLRRVLSNQSYPLSKNQFESYIAYLEERGYVVVEKRDKFDITLVRITADGLDVVDGRCSDVGVGVCD